MPVHANPMQPTMTEVFITQNGSPVDDTVDFSLDCFGHVRDWPGGLDFNKYGLKKALNATGDNDAVYAYSATCRPAEKCYIHNPDMPWMIKISYCDLSGTYRGKPFLLKNFSREPMLSSESEITQFGEQCETYTLSKQAETRCHDQRLRNERACDTFIIKGAPDFVNESGSYRTDLGPDYWQCRENSTQAMFSCIRNNGMRMNETEVKDALSYYQLRFDIPTDIQPMRTGTRPAVLPDQSRENSTSSTLFSDKNMQSDRVQTISPGIQRSPVESLYCGILNIISISC